VEDVEYGIALGRGGIRVRYAGEAAVSSSMVSSGRAAASQRRRWDLGRARLARAVAPSLLWEAARTRSALLLDLAVDLLIPPLSLLGLWILAGSAVSLAAGSLASIPAPASWMWLLSAAFLAVYLLRGWQLSGLGARGATALACVPFYLLWKIAVLSRGPAGAGAGWVRTAREERMS
jgi:hypothetical protein